MFSPKGYARLSLQILEVLVLCLSNEGEGLPARAGATGPADAVDVRLGVLRQVEIDHVVDPLDVDAARREVRRDERRHRPPAEGLEDALAPPLRHIAVECLDPVAKPREIARELVHPPLGAAEDEDARGVVPCEDRTERLELVGEANLDERLVDQVDRGLLGLHRDAHGVDGEAAGDLGVIVAEKRPV